MFWTHTFTLWYVGLFEAIFGVVWVLGAPYFLDQSRNFKREMCDPVFGERYRAVLLRRKDLENLSLWSWRAAGSVGIVLGAVTLLNGIAPMVSYALFCLSISVIMTFVFVGMRNRSDRRAALLAPRTASSSVPRWIYALTALVVLSPLVYIQESGLTFASAVVSLAGAAMIVVVSTLASSMPSLLTGEDADIELAVDERVRQGRISAFVILASAAPYVFMAITTTSVEFHKPLQMWGHLIASFAWVAIMSWFAFTLFARMKSPVKRVHVL